MGHSRRRTLMATALVGPLLLIGALGAAADDEPLSIDNLPSISDTDIDSLREPIKVPDIEAIEVPDIEPFTPEVTSSGADTVVSLDTDVLFDFGEAELGDSAQDAVLEAIKDVPDDAKVSVVGHTDSVGSDAANRKLSTQRAQAVADVIEGERDDVDVKVSGKGESDPVAPNTKGGKDNAAGREKNRRVELRYRD